MPYWKCYYHLIWATKHRQQIITADHETFFFEYIPSIATDLNSEIFAINGTSDHIHIAATIPPKIAISEWVKRIKGASSNECNAIFTNSDERFRWQGGYGVLTYGYKRLEYVVNYIYKQKEHHANDTTEAYLEHIGE